MAKRNVLLGDFLRAQGLITDAQLRRALRYQKEKGKMLGRALIDLDIIGEKELIKALGEQLGVQYVALKDYRIDPAVIKHVPAQLARQFQVLPLFRIGTTLTVGMVNPLDVVAIDAVSRACGLKVEPVVCSETDIAETIEHYYESEEQLAGEVGRRYGAIHEKTTREHEQLPSQNPAIAKLAETVLSTAVRNNATHVHCESGSEELVVRYRVDGKLGVGMTRPQKMAAPLIEHLKVLSGIDASRTSALQPGRLRLRLDDRLVEARLSIASTPGGEHAVVHLYDRSRLLRLEELGMSSAHLDCLRSLLAASHGLFVVAGPARSGRTTTLCALLQALRSPEKNIVTVEDPIEYVLDGCRQIEISSKESTGFAEAVLAARGQDPDILMISDIRDEQTARLAVEAALDGRFLLAALCAHDTAAAVARLLDLGVPPGLLAAALQGVLAQRLVRKNCPHCKVAVPAGEEIGRVLSWHSGEPRTIYRGLGCAQCNGSGYYGLTLLCEILPGTEAVRSQIRGLGSAGAGADELRKNTVGPLLQDGADKMWQGITSWEEVLRVTSPASTAGCP